MRAFHPPLAAAAALLLVACSPAQSAPVTANSADSPSPTTMPRAGALPTVIDNCGVAVDVGAPTERIVAIKSSAAELLLALGLADHMVGAAFLDGPLEPGRGTDGDEIPVISEGLPGQEAALAADPDAIFGGWESNFSADGVGERAGLEALGILTYVAPSACQQPAYQPDPMTFDLLFEHIVEAGEVFGAAGAADELAEELAAQLGSITRDEHDLSALWYSSGVDIPYVGAGVGAPQMIMEAAGLSNMVAGVDDTWTSLSWEAVAAEDPDVLVLVDAAWNTAESKIEMLESTPATAQLTAVQHGRYVVIPFAASEAGVRSVDAVQSIVEQLGAMEFDD